MGLALVRISLLTISPASPALTICNFTPASFSNCASSSLGRSNEPCVSTRSGTACAQTAGVAPRAAREIETSVAEKNRRCM
ncbi:hypothetical protein Y695_04778 [Hydrogenophaga sp. T4]|nr:hypothetical protein Y695_04778 [Hydrogenophaga sp. T4]